MSPFSKISLLNYMPKMSKSYKFHVKVLVKLISDSSIIEIKSAHMHESIDQIADLKETLRPKSAPNYSHWARSFFRE